MAANKYLAIISGFVKEVFATITSAGVANANQIVALDSTGHLDLSVMPVGVGPEVVSVVASENLSAGAFVNLWNNAGTLNARNADASSSSKPAVGFVIAAFSTSATATVYLLGQINTGVSGLTIGSDYWLSTVGGVTTTPATTSGFINQYLGKAFTATQLYFGSLDYQIYS